MTKSTKEKPEYDETLNHFPTFYIYQQFHGDGLNIPDDLASMIKSKKKTSKTPVKIYSRTFTIQEKKKREIDIYRVRRYVTTPENDVIILLIDGLDKEQGSIDAFLFKNKDLAQKFVDKLEEKLKMIKQDPGYQNTVVRQYYEKSGRLNMISDKVSDNQSIATRSSVYQQLTDEDFNYGTKKNGNLEATNKTDFVKTSKVEPKAPTNFDRADTARFPKLDETDESMDNLNEYKSDEDVPGYKTIKPNDVPTVNAGLNNISYKAPKISQPTSELLLSDNCDMSKVHAPKYSSFPSDLPSNLKSDLETQKLQYTGEFKAYENEVEFFDPKSKSTLFKAPYKDIVNVHEFTNQPTNLLLFRNDVSRRVSQMVLLNFDSRKAAKNACNIFKNQDVPVYQYTSKVSQTPMPERSYVPKNQDGNMIAPTATYGQNASRSLSFGGESSKFDSVQVKRKFRPPMPMTEFKEEDLTLMPDDGEWDYNIVYLNEDPSQEDPISDHGNIYMFVAHKIHD